MPSAALERLAVPVVAEGRVIGRTLLDLTIYLAGPSVAELETLIDLYEAMCPAHLRLLYKTTECELWFKVAAPELTISGRTAAAQGLPRPYLEPVRQRIRDGRAFDFQLWDGREIDDPQASWSLSCHRIRTRESGLHAFVRVLVPLETDPRRLLDAARAVADRVELRSGHGGPIFLYDIREQGPALDAAYALARRYWGLDLEDLNDTFPMTTTHIKGVNWITVVGPTLRCRPDIAGALRALEADARVRVEHFRFGSVLVAGDEPVAGDQNRRDAALDPYIAVAQALRPLFVDHYPDFPSERFIENGNTLGWFRRLIEPDGWR
jgi:hypothetical protein